VAPRAAAAAGEEEEEEEEEDEGEEQAAEEDSDVSRVSHSISKIYIFTLFPHPTPLLSSIGVFPYHLSSNHPHHTNFLLEISTTSPSF
jgi:hypothetical protein